MKEELELKKRGLGMKAVFQEAVYTRRRGEESGNCEVRENRKVRKECRRPQVLGKSDSKAVRVMTGRDSLQRWAPTTADHKNLD